MEIVLMALGVIGCIWYLIWLFPMVLDDWGTDTD